MLGDYYVCNDFSKKRCIFDRDLHRCIPKRLLGGGEDVVSSPMTTVLVRCKERCATVSCAERCEEMNYDDAPAGTRETVHRKVWVNCVAVSEVVQPPVARIDAFIWVMLIFRTLNPNVGA